jgi:tripartite-type tricarboxylate transporter receptor subunit TctC
MIGKHLSQSWGRALVIENRSGTDSTIATELGVRAAPDGYTLIFVTNAHGKGIRGSHPRRSGEMGTRDSWHEQIVTI